MRMMAGPQSRIAPRALILVLCTLLAGANASSCTSTEYLKQVAAVSELKTSAALLAGVLDIMGGSPENSTVFLPTGAAWAAFRKLNGASAPDLNRTVAIFLYNSVIGLGQASTAALAAASPIQTSAYVLQLQYAPSDINITLAFKAATKSTAGTVTSMSGVTGTLGKQYNFCNTYTYTVNKVLLPATTYAATPSTYIAEISAVAAASSASYPPPPATGTNPAAVTPAAAPPPPPTNAATSAVGSAFTLACGLAGAAVLLLA